MVAEAAPPVRADVTGPPMIAVAGGKGGVGTTTVAVNLAAALADRGARVVLVDANRNNADLLNVAGVHVHGGGALAEVLAGRCSVADALAPGPAGTLLLADRWSARARPDFSRRVQQRLLAELCSLADVADVLVIDIGSGLSPWTRRFWQRARLLVLVTTADDMAVMDTYAAVKLGGADAAETDLRVLVNRYDSERAAGDAARRIATACQRFLGRVVAALPSLPAHAESDEVSLRRQPPRVWEVPDSPFGHAVLWLGRAATDLLDGDAVAAGERLAESRRGSRLTASLATRLNERRMFA